MKTTLAALSLGAVLLLSSCGGNGLIVDPIDPEPPCPADLRFSVMPDSVNLLPGETAQPSFKVFGCGGTVELDVTPRWESADTDVATVDASSGLITAQLTGGNTKVTVSEDEYNTAAVVAVSVAVVDPVP